MKRLNLFLLTLIATCAISAQVSTQNYIRTRRMMNEAGNSYLDNIGYYDGIGRPYQTVEKAVKSGIQTGSILATLQEYDGAGRETNTWLPITTTADYVAPATFKSSAPGNYSSDAHPYRTPVYEDSPLNRILEQYGPGAAWRNGHPVGTEYMANTATMPLNCINYNVSNTGVLTNNGNYAPNQLQVVKSTDEDMNVGYTFTDKLGRTVLNRQMKGSEAHDTYYVYDDYGNLYFVLQPMYQSTANLDLYAFQYKYDSRKRCVWKKLPDAQYMEYVYDNADRLTFSQDGNQRSTSKWTYYMYDGLSRLTQQGECVNKVTSSNVTVHIRNFYDSYTDFRSAIGNNSNYPDDVSGNGKGSLTGSIITVLGGSTPIWRAHYYDIKGRVTKTVENNLLGGYETTNFAYTFTDKPATTTHIHTATGKTTRSEIYTYTYDHADRLTTVKHRLNGTEVILAANTYDNFGRLTSKSLHGSASNKLTYAYNIRSWVTGITGTNFNQNLYYNTGVGTASYNGNISSMTWKGNDGVTRGYKFSYDELSRMQNATYGETAAINTNTNRFTENVTGYDKNGNILGLQRYGQTGASTYGLIDNLTMTLSGNRLNRVDDAATVSAYSNSFEFKNGANSTAEYAYDANGNLTKDLNKGITNIQYNVLNLPSSITFSDGSTINYLYSADGTKLRTTHIISGTTTTTDYCSNVIYENGTAKLLLTEEGYVSLNDNRYHYYLQDHQGNNRVVVNQSGTVEETNHYYPFGGVFANSASVQPYKYNGKEYDSKKGLNWHDYGARHYDAAVGRFMTMDPLAEKYYPVSPYAYCGNSPVKFIDLTGMNYTDYRNDKGEILFKTDDGISEIIIVQDPNISTLEKEGKKLEEQGKINDPEANKEELHPLGKDINEYKNSYKTGNDNVDNGYVVGYDITYNEKSGFLTSTWMHIQGVSEEGAQILGGYYVGKSEGKIDKKEGRINKLEPFKGLKNNEPLIKIKP